MLRWNGWGDENTTMELPRAGKALLNEWVGETAPSKDYPLEKLLAGAPPSRLPKHRLVTVDSMERLVHSHGQSLPDWVALRSGEGMGFVDGVAYPQNTQDIVELLGFAAEQDINLIPFGGGTSVVGHLTPRAGGRPVLSLSLERMNRLLWIDSGSSLALFEAGVRGPDLEAQLAARGFTLGHYPQSFECSTLGGWVVTRSSGQQSMYYGRIEALFAGGEMVTPRGLWELLPHPASAAGPDLRQMVLGSEGRMGVLSTAKVRVSPLPEFEAFYGAFLPSWEAGVDAVRQMAVARLPLCMIRLSNNVETITQLALSGHETQSALVTKYLGLRRIPEKSMCMILFGLTGQKAYAGVGLSQAKAIIRRHGGVIVGQTMGNTWKKKRFLIPYLRNTLWEAGYAVDTLETAVTWDKVTLTMEGFEQAIKAAAAKENEKVHVFTHLSHIYPSGSSVYTSYVFRPGKTPGQTLSRWKRMKAAASSVITQMGGTISHQHGVGEDHAPYLPAEKGKIGMDILKQAFAHMDSQGRMNPGKLLE